MDLNLTITKRMFYRKNMNNKQKVTKVMKNGMQLSINLIRTPF